MEINNELLNELKNPENEFRPFNYWGWLENIEPDEVKWQIKEMAKAGLGGYVMHARGGLTIPYMGEQWMAAVNAMVDEGKNLGMATIIDDEDGWPSGFGAGIVNGKGEEYWLKWLECEKIKYRELKTVSSTLGVYLLKDNTAYRIKDISEVEDIDEEVLHVYYSSSKYYVDNLDPKVVREFIDASYDAYYKKFSGEFGKGVMAIFSDEPQLARDHITWSLILPGEFRKRFGYDLLEVLPAIYFDIDGYEKVRFDFWSLLNSLFTVSYSKQIGEWCEKHGVIFTGHTCYEEFFMQQIECSAGTMPFYEYMHIPGIDWLCRTPVDSMAVKQVTSVAEQLGKKRVLSEMYGCAGWNVSFEELKWIGEWHYVLGVNLMLQHLGLYSLRGSRKREYPASLFFQQPWWDEFKVFNDYFARLSKIMSESTPVINLLVLHSLRSGWIAYSSLNQNRVKGIEEEFKILTQNLLSLNYDFHYGDEEIMLRHGRIEGNEIIVGKFSYKAVIIPPSLSLDRNTIELLEQFVNNGGMVISIGEFPYLVEGKPDAHIGRLEERILHTGNTVVQIENILKGVLRQKIKILNCDGSINKDVYCCTRKVKDDIIYYIVNTNKENSREIHIKLEDGGNISRINILDCTEEAIKDLKCVRLEPTESIMLVSRENCMESPVNDTFSISENRVAGTKFGVRENILPDGEWDLIQGDSNAITLDYCIYSIDDGPWEEEIPVILLQEKLLSLGRPVDVALKFKFTLAHEIKSRLYLVIEEPKEFSIFINGKQLNYIDQGWWLDKCFRKIALDDIMHAGDNEIILKRYFYCSEKVYLVKNDKSIHEAEANRITVETELESIYLLGDFSVDIEGEIKNTDKRAIFAGKPFILTAPKEKVLLDNLVTQGYPFFAGRLTLSKKFIVKKLNDNNANIELTLDRPDSIVTKIFINNLEVNTFLWAPYRADVTQLIKEGENKITVELINSCRNLLGPHHSSDGELYAVGPASYCKDTGYWTDDYCFVKFGVRLSLDNVKKQKIDI